MGKFKMPTDQEFFKRKKIYDPRKAPVWVYIENEMRANAARKPYNTKVANWLLFLKDLRYHYYCQAKAKYNRLLRECGPRWYLEYSNIQRNILSDLKANIREDLLEDIPRRVRKSLWDIGMTARFPTHILMAAIAECNEDPGLFIWYLFTKMYKVPPSELLPYYDMTSMLLMSALVFIDLDECVESLKNLTTRLERAPPKDAKKKSYYFEPNVKYGQYLQRMQVPCYSNHPATIPKPKKPMPLAYKIKLKSDESFEALAKRTDFLEKRKQRNVKQQYLHRKCKYKFWEPPATLRNTDPKQTAYVLKVKMFKSKAKARFLKYKPPFENTQVHIASVSYSSGKAVYVFASVVTLPTGYILIHGGTSWIKGEFITRINGMWHTEEESKEKCDKSCHCLATWEASALSYVTGTKCLCHHEYDLEKYDTLKETYFYPPTRELPLVFNHAKIYQLDSLLDYVHDVFKFADKSESTATPMTTGTLQVSDISEKELLKIFLSDLVDTPLLIPHLPEANLLNNLQEWVRRRVRGCFISPQKHKRLMLKSERRWLDLKHIDFRAQAYFIPFSLNQLKNMNWSHRPSIQKLFNMLLKNFEARTRQNQFEQCRLWWPTMAYDVYPSRAFLDMFFTYMPGKFQDTFVVNPYSTSTMKYEGKTCPLRLGLH